MFGTFPEFEEESQIVEKEKIPQIMLGVGYFPPKLSEIFWVKNFPYKFFLKIKKAKINKKSYNLNNKNYYLYITKNKLKNPQYYLIILKNKKIIYKQDIVTNKKINFEGGSMYLTENVKYYLGIGIVKDYGLSLVIIGVILLCISFFNFLLKNLKLC
jgi:hypothetical protein